MEVLAEGHVLKDGKEYYSIWAFKNKNRLINPNTNSTNYADAIKLNKLTNDIIDYKPNNTKTFTSIKLYPLSLLKEYYALNKVNTLSFTNFRRFPTFGPIAFSDITFLVGRNNSGKSTFVKAMMLMVNYLKSDRLDVLDFNQYNVEDLNIVTYDRAKCKSLKAQQENFIDFTFQIENLEFYLKLTGNKDQVQANVTDFIIREVDSGFKVFFNPSQNFINFQWENETSQDATVTKLSELIKEKNKQKRNLKDTLSEEFISLNSDIKNLKNQLSALKKQKKNDAYDSKIYLSVHYTKNEIALVLNEIFIAFSSSYDVRFAEQQKAGGKVFKDKEKQSEFESLTQFKQHSKNIERFFESVVKLIEQITIKYLPATLNKQSALFSIREKNNALAQAIHEYAQLGIQKSGSAAENFVNQWIKEEQFEIGDSIELNLIAGESYECNILSNGISIPLADKGMGSVQAMLLILRIATIIHKKEKFGGNYTLLVEEPELNLHPALQSRLCEMFYQANQTYKIRLIVETHSEYLIRKSQLIVKRDELEIEPNENPFSVIYFDKDIDKNQPVWNMLYRQDGKFSNEFGTGFFDESTNLAFELF